MVYKSQMKQLIFENRNGITEATLNESLAGAFTKGALVLGYMGLMTLAVINPRVTASDMSRTDNIFGFMFKALNNKMMGQNKEKFSSDVQKMVERMNELNEASVGKITPETILKVMGKAGELTEEQEKYLVASYYYREYAKKMIQELNEFDYSKANKQSKANAQQFVAKMQAALEMTKNPGKSEEGQEEKPEEKPAEQNKEGEQKNG